jgi:hypothetical protein
MKDLLMLVFLGTLAVDAMVNLGIKLAKLLRRGR